MCRSHDLLYEVKEQICDEGIYSALYDNEI